MHTIKIVTLSEFNKPTDDVTQGIIANENK